MIYTGAPKSRFVYSQLTEKKENLIAIIGIGSTNIGIGTTIVESYKIPPSALDEIVLSKLQTINTKKQEIVTLTTNNFNGGSPLCPIVQTTSFSSDIIVGSSKTVIEYNCLGVTSICSQAGRAEVRQDTLNAWTFPVVESVDTTKTFYTQGEGYQQVTSATLGLGVTNYLISNLDNRGGIHVGSTLIGYYYPIASGCAGTISSITSITNQITALRTEIANMLEEINALKKVKTEAQIDFWYENLGQDDSKKRLVGIQSAIYSMERNEIPITSYELNP